MATQGTTKRGFLPGYFEGLQFKGSKLGYLEKVKNINGEDPYEIPRNECIDDVDSWPNVTYIHVGMYLLFSKSPYTEDQLMNYKSLDCYQNFANGWVQEIFSKKSGENRLLTSPDGLVSCDCCGAGGCEIKCPFCHKNDDICKSVQDKNFCLEVTATGTHRLKRNHQYYYQVQLQLICTDLRYIDFVVWTKKGLFIERIFPDKMFWEEKVPKEKDFFLQGILPEVIGRWYSRPVTSSTEGLATVEGENVNVFCYCMGAEHGEMVACDNESCNYQWFHLECLKLNTFPKSKTWYCPDCQKQRRGKSMRTQRSE